MDRRDTMTAGAGRARPNPTARHATWLRARSGDMVAMSVPHVRATMESRRRHFSSARVPQFWGGIFSGRSGAGSAYFCAHSHVKGKVAPGRQLQSGLPCGNAFSFVDAKRLCARSCSHGSTL